MRPILLATPLFFVCLGACGGGRVKTKPIAGGAGAAGSTNVTEPSSAPEADAGTQSPTSPTALIEKDCESLLQHMFALIYERRIEELPETERPSPEDLVVAKDKLRSELKKQCVGATREHFAYDCVMASSNMEAVGACMESPAGS
ncbi:MAG: hypothetical protein GY811_00810 [Myxococcales bacterium]|nr:hypothetical protein [Myxococcales bacterium]